MAVAHMVLDVPGVSCRHCKAAIEGSVGRLAGVRAVDVDVEAKNASVEFDDEGVSLETIIAAVTAEGYEVAGSRSAG